MANRQILEALEKYSGDVESLNQVVGIATQELGSDWTEKIYEDMSDASADIKERLDHAFNYYAATTAWNEIQNYLTQTEPLNYSETLERVPVLEHWLSFFGAAGEEVVEELRNKLRKQAQDSAQNTTALDEPFAVSSLDVQEKIDNIFSDKEENASDFKDVSAYLDYNNSVNEQPVIPEMAPEETTPSGFEVSANDINDIFGSSLSDTTIQQTSSEDFAQTVSAPVTVQEQEAPTEEQMPIMTAFQERRTDVFDPIVSETPSQDHMPLQQESEQAWQIGKLFRQINFIDNIESWISFRCLELGYTDFYTYRYYGFLVDVLDKTIDELTQVLAQTQLYDLIEARQAGGVQFLQNKLLAYQKESKEAHEGVLSDLSPLMREDLSVDDLKNRLGGMDLSGEKEYLGPAPDGFEMIDDPYENMNEEELKKEYEKIEAQGDLAPQQSIQFSVNSSSVASQQHTNAENTVQNVKNTSQMPQNSVQPKMAFKWNKPGASS